MARKGENIYKRKDGRWEGRYIKTHFNGKIKYGYVYGKTYTEVKQKLQNKRGVFQKDSESLKSDTKLETIVTEWLGTQKYLHKESTFARYHQIATTHIIPSLGSKKIKDINSVVILKYTDTLLKNGRLDGKGGLSAKTVKDIFSVLKLIINYAKQNQYTIETLQEKAKYKSPCSKVRVLSLFEQECLTNYLLENVDFVKLGILFSLYTGLRLGEVCALKWNDIDLSTGILSVSHTMQRIKDVSPDSESKTKIIITEPKSEHSKRDVPIPKLLIEIANQLQCDYDSFVLTGERTSFIEPRTMQNKFKNALSYCNLNDVNYHALRHTFATRCIDLGFEITTLSEILGHSNVNITLNRYVHTSLANKKANMNKIQIAQK